MFTQAEMDQQARDTAEMGVIDYIDADYPAEVLEDAISMAIDEFDAEQTEEGWNDCTNYKACAERAIELWEEHQQGMHEAMLDDMAHAHADRLAGL